MIPLGPPSCLGGGGGMVGTYQHNIARGYTNITISNNSITHSLMFPQCSIFVLTSWPVIAYKSINSFLKLVRNSLMCCKYQARFPGCKCEETGLLLISDCLGRVRQLQRFVMFVEQCTSMHDASSYPN